MNSVVPTGGVYRPIARLTTITMSSSCTGSGAALCAGGREHRREQQLTRSGQVDEHAHEQRMRFIQQDDYPVEETFSVTQATALWQLVPKVSSQPMAAGTHDHQQHHARGNTRFDDGCVQSLEGRVAVEQCRRLRPRIQGGEHGHLGRRGDSSEEPPR